MEWKLTNTNLCSYNKLTWISKGNRSRIKKGAWENSATISLESPNEITQERRNGAWENSSLACGCFRSKWARESLSESLSEGYGGIYTPSHRKLAVGESVPGYSGYISGYSGHWGSDTLDSENFTDGEQLPEDSRYISGYSGRLCPDIPDQDTITPGLARDFTRRLFIMVRLFWAQLPHQHL
jgi:hypothetical protein